MNGEKNTTKYTCRYYRHCRYQGKIHEWATKLLSQKVILAWILKYCTDEFSGYSVEYIRDECIEGTPEVRCKSVHQDCQDAEPEMIQGMKIQGMNTVDKSGNDGTITYDVKFQAAVPGESGIIQMIINVELQLDDTPGYPVVKRSIYYSSRMISSQYGTVFTKEHYEKIRKVYSIWICPFVPGIRKDSIREYRFEENVYSGNYHEKRQNYDLIDIVILGLGDTGQKSEHEIVNMLTVLFSDSLESEEKKKILTEEYNIAMTRGIEEGVDTMCNLSEGTYRRGVKDGISQGIGQGISQGVILSLMDLLSDVGIIPQVLEDKLAKVSNIETLRILHKKAARVSDIEEFEEELDKLTESK